jgi:multidrug efflux pump subunit AcrA (membrane-fusion protein)
MTARCRILTAQKANALRLPLEALGKEQDKDYVLRIVPDQTEPNGKPKTEKVFVKVGLRSASHAEILDGLREGDQVQKPPFAGPQRRQFEMGRNREENSDQEE